MAKNVIFKLFALLLIMGMLLSSVACSANKGNSETNGVTTVADNSSTTGTTAAAEKVKISIYHMYVDSFTAVEGVAFRDLVKQFPIDNPNVEIVEEKVAHDIYMPKIQTLGASNELPEIFPALPSLQQSFAKNNAIKDFNSTLDGDAEWKGSFIDGAFDDHTFGGKIWAMPYTSLLSHVVYYNKSIFEKCGITKFPETLDEFKAIIPKIKGKGYIPVTVGNKGKAYLAACVMPGIVFRYMDLGWYNSIKENKGAKFTDPQYIKAIDTLGELIKLGMFNDDLNSVDQPQAKSQYYGTGKAAMFISGSWEISSFITDIPREILDVTEYAMIPPQESKKENASYCPGGTGWGWCITSNASGAKLDATVKFLKQMTGKEIQTRIIDGGAEVVVKVTPTDPTKLDPFVNKYLAFKNNVKMIPNPEIQLSSLYVDASYTGYQNYSAGGITSMQLAKQLQKAQDEANK